MNITISRRPKSMQPFHINLIHQTDKQRIQVFQPKKSASSIPIHEPNLRNCEPSQVTKWLLRRCFTKTNSILEEQPQKQQQQIQRLFIHSLSSRHAKQNYGNKQKNGDQSATSTRRCSPLLTKSEKLKTETARQTSKTARISRLKTYQVKLNANTIPTSCSTSGHASRQRLNVKIAQSIQKQMGEGKSLAHLENNESILLSKLNWKLDSEEKYKIQDCIYGPIFSIGSSKDLRNKPPLESPYRQPYFQYESSPQIESDQSFIISRGLDQIFQISAEQNSPQQQDQLLNYGPRQKMFVIYEKYDEALQYE